MNKRTALITIAAVVIVILGGVGYFVFLKPSGTPDSQAACEQEGGLWSTAGYAGCLEKSEDAGKSCTDGAQCSTGICRYTTSEQERQQLTTGPLTGVTGTCYTYKTPTGCVSQVKNGTVSTLATCFY